MVNIMASLSFNSEYQHFVNHQLMVVQSFIKVNLLLQSQFLISLSQNYVPIYYQQVTLIKHDDYNFLNELVIISEMNSFDCLDALQNLNAQFHEAIFNFHDDQDRVKSFDYQNALMSLSVLNSKDLESHVLNYQDAFMNFNA